MRSWKLPIFAGIIFTSLLFSHFANTEEFANSQNDAELFTGGHAEKIFSVAEAVEMSKHPKKQIVFHYDADMPFEYVSSIRAQIVGLRHHGYDAVALPGGPVQGLQIYIAGLTSPKLRFDGKQIFYGQPTDYSAAYYKKLIGEPAKR